MPRTTELGKIPAVDLAYAVGRLIQEGKTSLAEVRRFAEERPARIAALERELATLRAGHAAAKAAGHPAGPRATAVKRPKRKFTMTAKARAARRRARWTTPGRPMTPSARQRWRCRLRACRSAPSLRFDQVLHRDETPGRNYAVRRR